MKLIVFGVCALVALATGFSLEKTNEIAVDDEHDFMEHNGCSCFPNFCYCEGREENFKVGATLMVNELRHSGCCTKISGAFFINNIKFEQDFPVNHLEDFCRNVKGKRFCFRVDVVDHMKGFYLKGCLQMSKPERIPIGCFKLPLLSHADIMNNNVDGTESDDVTTENPDEYDSSVEDMLFGSYRPVA